MKKMISWPFKFMKSLYNWTLCWAKTKNSSYALFSIAFIESSFFPIPPDVLLIPMVIAEPRSWWKKALICTVGSILGALLGYVVGKIFYDIIGITILNFYNLQSAVTVIGEKYANNAFLSIFAGAFTPIPYKVMTISAGIFNISLPILIVASIFGRGGRFFIISVALKIFGAKIQTTVEKNFNLLSIIFLVLLITGFVVLKHIT